MASHMPERGGNTASNAADQIKRVADDAADTMGEKSNSASETAKRYSRNATDKLNDVAEYVRDTDAEDIGRDVVHAATAHPVASLLVLSAVVIGGSMLVAALLQDDGADTSMGSRRPARLASAASGLGPRGAETLSRIRDAAFSFVFDKAVDKVDGIFPGFREHYERG